MYIKSFLIKKIKYLRDASLLRRVSPEDRNLITRICSRKLTYLGAKKLISLVNTCRTIEEKKLPGFFLEAGCALGGSSILIASIKNTKRSLFIYDVFEMIPPPTKEDTPDVHNRYKTIKNGKSVGIDGDIYYGYQKNLYETVQANMKSFDIDLETQNVKLVKGLVQDTMKIDQPVAFAHVDVDWYEPVKTCLNRITPYLVMGGSIILDDYHIWGGCKKATDEFLQKAAGQYLLDGSSGSLKITKIKD